MRIGRQEPTTSVTLPYRDSDGQLAIDLYEMTGRTAMEWQRILIYDILARNEDSLWTHTRYGYAIPRRNGKGEVIIMRELYGLAVGEKILHTAHLQSTSHSAWERLIAILDMLQVDYSSIKAKGQEFIRLDKGGEIHFRTRTATGALGEGFDLVIIDEAQEYKIEHQTALKYVVTSSKNPQTLLCGTPPTAVSAGTVFKDMRTDVITGHGTNMGWAEWSVDQMSDIKDKDLWYETNPSLGITLTERNVQDELGSTEAEKIDFNIQRLGLWIAWSQESAISAAAWDACEVKNLPEMIGKLSVGIKYAKDGMTVSVAVAAKIAEDKAFIEVYGRKPVRDGTSWILTFLSKLGKNNIGRLLVDGKNGQDLLKKDLADASLKKPDFATVAEVIEANQLFENSIYQGNLVHMTQPSLTAVVTNCTHRAIGSGGGFGYKAIKEELDISLLEAVALALYGAINYKDRKQKYSY